MSTRRENVVAILTQTIGAIDIAKGVVPIQLGQGILSGTASILHIVKVGLPSAFYPSICQSSSPRLRTPSRTRKTAAS